MKRSLSTEVEELKKRLKEREYDVARLIDEVNTLGSHVSDDEIGSCSKCGIIQYTWEFGSEILRPPKCFLLNEDNEDDWHEWYENKMCWMCRRDEWGESD